MEPTARLVDLIAQTERMIAELPPRARSKALFCYGRRLALSGAAERAAEVLALVTHEPERSLARQALQEPPAPAAVKPLFPQLTAFLKHGQMSGAERVIARMADDFDKIVALHELARAQHARGDWKACRSALRRADTLWRLHRGDWWFFPWLGDQLQVLLDCEETTWARGLLEEAEGWVAVEESEWLRVHGWCSLARGALLLEKSRLADLFFAEALIAAERRFTRRARNDARQLLVAALFVCGRVEQALSVASQGGKRQTLEGLLSAIRVVSKAVAKQTARPTREQKTASG